MSQIAHPLLLILIKETVGLRHSNAQIVSTVNMRPRSPYRGCYQSCICAYRRSQRVRCHNDRRAGHGLDKFHGLEVLSYRIMLG